MRLTSVEYCGRRRAAVESPGGLHLLPAEIQVEDLVAAGLTAAVNTVESATCTAPVPASEVRRLPPLRPGCFRDFMTFADHVAATAGPAGVSPEWHTIPTFYFSNPAAFVATGALVSPPPGSEAFDFELEVGAVVSGDRSGLSPAAADNCLFGLVIINDWSARDLQAVEMRIGLGPAKGKDSATTIGPCLVTMDEFASARIPDGRIDLEMAVHLNGNLYGLDSLANMSWTFGELLAYASRGAIVASGDLLGSGTCGNGGCLLERWVGDRPVLKEGDEVRMTVERIGTIANIVGSPQPRAVLQGARRPHRRYRPLPGLPTLSPVATVDGAA
jgi:2-keto-4-pentenoate hydratase/2-oxohepta-3-ene-1,7-dioic acid hydratase in catechol pathway